MDFPLNYHKPDTTLGVTRVTPKSAMVANFVWLLQVFKSSNIYCLKVIFHYAAVVM